MFVDENTPEIFESVKRRGGFEPNKDIVGDQYNWEEFTIVSIETNWWLFHQGFQMQGRPLSYAIEGNYAPEGGINLFGSGKGSDWYLAYVSPELVIQISKALERFEIQKIKGLTKLDEKEYSEYVIPYFQDLLNFYRDTAGDNKAVFIIIG